MQACLYDKVTYNHVQNILRKPKFSEKVKFNRKPPSPIYNAVISSPACSSDIILTCDSMVGGGVDIFIFFQFLIIFAHDCLKKHCT